VGYLLRDDSGAWNSLVGLIGHDRLKQWLDLEPDLLANRIADDELPEQLRTVVKNSLLDLLSEQASLSHPSKSSIWRDICSNCDLGIGTLATLRTGCRAAARGAAAISRPAVPPSETSNTARFWVGVALSLPALVVVVVLYSGVGAVMGADSSGVSGVLPLLLTLLLVVGFVWAIVHDRTRFVALGILAGFAIVFVLLAGACVVLLSSAGGFS